MSEPQKVEIAAVAPAAVDAVTAVAPTAALPSMRVQKQADDPSVPAKTTFQEDLTTAGQRQVNLIWESTQGRIALWVVAGTVGVNGLVVVLLIGFNRDLTAAQAMALSFLNMICTAVISFYFSRTNHTQIGGTGNKPNDEYKGR